MTGEPATSSPAPAPLGSGRDLRSEALRWVVRGVGLALGAAAVYALVTGIMMAGRVLVLIFVAILLASALEPVIGWVRNRLGLGRAVTILLVYAAFFVAVLGLALLVVPAAINQLADLTERLPPFFDRARAWAGTIELRPLGTSVTALINAAQRTITPAAGPNPSQVVEAGMTVAEAVAAVVTLLAIVFFWITEHARLQRYALAFVPADRRAQARDVWNEVELRLGSWVRGQLILMTTMGVATGAAYAVLGLDSPILLGLLAGIAEAIPIVGPLLGAIPALLVASTKGVEMVLAVGIVYVVIQLVEGNILVPLVMRNTIGISPFLVITSLLVGAAVGGITGAFLAVPVVAAVEVLLERLQARDMPVAQHPASTATPPEQARRAPKRSRPDSLWRRALGR